MLEPLEGYVLTRLLPTTAPSSTLWLPEKGDNAKPAEVIAGGDFTAGETVLISMKRATLVGSDYLVPADGILARLA